MSFLPDFPLPNTDATPVTGQSAPAWMVASMQHLYGQVTSLQQTVTDLRQGGSSRSKKIAKRRHRERDDEHDSEGSGSSSPGLVKERVSSLTREGRYTAEMVGPLLVGNSFVLRL
jgi:hypothetical protein